jgi:hypothetical protein
MLIWVERHYRLRDGNLQRVNRIATREHARRAGDARAATYFQVSVRKPNFTRELFVCESRS